MRVYRGIKGYIRVCRDITPIMENLFQRFGFRTHQGMEKKLETTLMGFIETTIRVHSLIPS